MRRLALALFAAQSTVVAVHKGTVPATEAEIPYPVGYVMKIDETEAVPGYGDCLQGTDDVLGSFCSGGMISEGVFLTAAHCFQEGGQTAKGGTLNVNELRVGLGMKYPYRMENGTCTGTIRGVSEGIYKVKAVFIHKDFKVVSTNFNYNNGKTGTNGNTGSMGLDHMDAAVVFLEDCAVPAASGKARFGRIAGGSFSPLSQMWAKFESKVNTEGMPGTFWGYGESEDDRAFPAYQIDGKRAPKPVRRGNWNFNRATSPPSLASNLQRKVWPNCDWLPDATPVWNMTADTIDSAYASTTDGSAMKATPYIACTPRNPNDATVKSRCTDKTTSADCTASKAESGSAYCSWSAPDCSIATGVAGGIGLVTYPSTGGGDSGAATWYIENDNKLTLNDREQLNLVHIGIVFAASTFFPAWDQTVRTDYLQNWLANVLDRDTCAGNATKDYFVGWDESAGAAPSATDPPITQSGWDLTQHYVGQVKGVTGAVGLGQLAKRANAGDWTAVTVAPTPASPTPASPTPTPTPASPTPASPTPASPTPASPTPASPTPASSTSSDGHDHAGHDHHDDEVTRHTTEVALSVDLPDSMSDDEKTTVKNAIQDAVHDSCCGPLVAANIFSTLAFCKSVTGENGVTTSMIMSWSGLLARLRQRRSLAAAPVTGNFQIVSANAATITAAQSNMTAASSGGAPTLSAASIATAVTSKITTAVAGTALASHNFQATVSTVAVAATTTTGPRNAGGATGASSSAKKKDDGPPWMLIGLAAAAGAVLI